ncbi:MAG TPA: ABC transporter ATP-binding protein [Geothrix sp.]|nr:ABC transporter ATP-binding protein [Geothrix sp.]
MRLGGEAILHGLDFEIRKGERLGLIGPNGAGKTTLLEAMAGLLPLADGNVSCRESSFYLPDGVTPWADLRVGELLSTFQRYHHREAGDRTGLVEALDLGPVVGKRMRELSKGNRKRVLLALAFLTRATLLLLDEPFDGLDIHQARRAMKLIESHQASGRTFLLSIHELRQAEGLCERFLLLVAGRLVATGTLQELRERTGTGDGLEEVFLAL